MNRAQFYFFKDELEKSAVVPPNVGINIFGVADKLKKGVQTLTKSPVRTALRADKTPMHIPYAKQPAVGLKKRKSFYNKNEHKKYLDALRTPGTLKQRLGQTVQKGLDRVGTTGLNQDKLITRAAGLLE